MATAYTDQVQKVYIAYYGRAADPVGLAYWAAKVETDGLSGIMASFGASAEATTLYGSLTNTAKVNALFQQSFGRDADFAGLMYYAGQLTAGTMTAATIAQNIFDGASGTDATILANKLVVAKAYTAAIDTSSEVVAYSGTVAAASARALLTTVDAATVTASFDVATSVASIVSVANATPAVAAASLALTTGVDSLTGAAGVDTISGTVGNTDPTINAGDSINGGAGSDTFAITSTGTTGTVAGLTLSGVETVRVADTSTGATTINLAGVSGVETLKSFGSAHTGLLTFSNVGSITALELSNTSSTSATTLTYATSAVAGTADTQAITLDTAAQTGDITVAGVETVNVTASGSSTLALAAGSAATVSVTASDATTIDLDAAGNTSLSTVTAAGSTGAVTFLMDMDNSVEVSVTGGDANDLIDTSAGAFGVNDTIDGGAGTADTIRFANSADKTSTDMGATTATISNVEVLELQANDDATNNAAADLTVDMDIMDGVTSILLDSNDTEFASVFTLNDLSAGQAAAISASGLAGTTNGTDIELDLKDGTGATDSATITASMATGNVLTVGDANGDIESLSVVMNGDVAATLTIDSGDFAGSATTDGSITVSGGGVDRALTITGTIVAETLDMTGVISDTTVTIGGVNSTITGGTGDDVITMTTNLTGNDTIDGKAGTDRIVIDPAANIAVSPTITNVEELEIGATATVSLTMTTASIPKVVLQAQNAVTNVVTLTNMAGVTSITADSGAANTDDDFNGVTLSGTGYAGTADAMSINVTSDTDQSTLGAMVLTGIETLTVTAAGSASDFDTTIGNITGSSLNTVTVTSSGYGTASTSTDIVLGTVSVGTDTMESFDASGANTGVSVTLSDMQASATVTGSGYADTISIVGSLAGVVLTAGAGIDNITGSTLADTIYGGAGNDIIDGGAAVDTIYAGAGNDVITGGTGADVITLTTGIETLIRNGDGTTDGADTISGFTAGAGGDLLDFTTNDSSGQGTVVLTEFASYATVANWATATAADTGDEGAGAFVALGADISAGTEAALVTLIAGAYVIADIVTTSAAGAVTDQMYIAVDNGVDTFIFHFENAGTSGIVNTNRGTIIADDVATLALTLVGLSDATTLTSANVADFLG